MLREKLIHHFFDIIEAHGRFSHIEFEISSKTKDNDIVDVLIFFKENESYYVAFHVENTVYKQTPDIGDMCPGVVMMVEDFHFDTITDVDSIIKKWLNNLWEELSIASLTRKIQEREELIKEFVEKIGPLDNEYFTPQEEIKVKSQLDIIEEKLKEVIETSAENKAHLEEQLAALHKDFETLKESIPIYKKNGWVRNYATKIVKWGLNADNRKLLKDAYSFAVELLPDEIKQLMP